MTGANFLCNIIAFRHALAYSKWLSELLGFEITILEGVNT